MLTSVFAGTVAVSGVAAAESHSRDKPAMDLGAAVDQDQRTVDVSTSAVDAGSTRDRTAGYSRVAGPGLAALQEPGFQTETVKQGLNQPTAMTFLPDGRALLLQKGGDVLIVDPATGDSSTYMTVSDLDTAGEEGLIDITLDPNFEQNNHIYIYYTPESSSKNRIARFTHQENNGGLTSSADTASEFVVWEDNNERQNNYHHGGGLDFGPDGKLYLTIGEEVVGSQAQDLTQAGGSVIRVNKDGTIPQDNPFVDGPGGNVDAIWAYGLRNPFRAEWDLQSENPRYYIAEVGGNQQSTAQEDLHIGEKGANYGWPDCEGTCSDPAYTDALYTYPHEGSGASITGGVVYHGDQFPSQYDGAYFFADYVRGWMKYLTFDDSGNVSSVTMFDDDVGSVVEIDQGPNGSLYYLDIASGTLKRVSHDGTTDAEPTIDAPENVFVDEGESKQLSISASDADGDSLTLAASNLPDFASFTDNGDGTGTLSLSPSAGDAGQYQMTISANDGDDTTSKTITISVLEPGAEQVVHRIHAGSGAIDAIDNGPDWTSDSQYMQTAGDTSDWTGTTYSVGSSVPASTPDSVFETERYPTGGSTIDYDLPATQGETYEVRLYFIEQYSQAQNPGDRVFDVTAEGDTKLNDYDTVADVGYKNATMKSFNVTADDGTLDLAFTQDGGSANPFMYGVEVVKPGDDSQNQAPNAAFSYSPSGPSVDETVTFDASGSSDSDGSVQSYKWDFDGDGQTDATGQTTSHAFTTSGDTTVTLTVTDDSGATATETKQVTVSSTDGQQTLYRVNAGGPELPATDGGPTWTADSASAQSQYLVDGGGTTNWNTFETGELNYSVGTAVPPSTPDAVFEYERYETDGDLQWAFPVTQGDTYEVRLYMIEQYSEAEPANDRVLDVTSEGETKLNDYNVVSDVGYKNGTMKTFEATADNGTLDITIAQDGGNHNANVFGIEIVEAGANQPPEATIEMPADGSSFQAGDNVTFAGSATDPEDGSLDGSQLEWQVRFLHNEHWHPYLDSQSGSSGNFTVPTSGHDFHDDTAYQINLTATDADGATDTETVVIEPDKVNVTLDTQPSGLDLYLDGIPRTTPYVHDTLIDFQHTVSAPQTQCVNGTQYEFDSWSDGSPAERTITAPDSDVSYTAVYTEVGQCGDNEVQSIADAVASQNAPTDIIGLQEIQLAVNWWASEEPVPGTDGKTIGQLEIQQLVNMWATNATIGDGNQSPTADFHVHDPVAGQSATYHAEATDDDGSITQYEWDFDGDGTFEESTTTAQIQHTFDSAGDYQVTLRVTDDDGATETVTKTVSVSEQQTAQVMYRVNAGGPELQAADDGPNWTVDNASDQSQSPYLVGDGDVTVHDQQFNVTDSVPSSTPSQLFVTERYVGQEMSWDFPATAGDTYEVRLYYIEQWAPNAQEGDRIFDVNIDGQTVQNDYDVMADVGFDNATMKSFTVTADDGTLDIDFAQDGGTAYPLIYGIEIIKPGDGSGNQAPIASVSPSATDVETGQTVDFDAAASSDPDGSIASYEWDFDGDGTTDATGEQVSHAFQSAGTYQVTLTVTDNDGATATTTEQVSVSAPAEEGSASISLNEGNNNIDTSTWKTGAVEVENTGDKQIESVTFDLSTAAMPDIVFGPLTDSGTPGNAVKDASGAGGFQTTYSQPHDGNPDDGYDALTLTFDNFEPGETFTASLDTDATSIKGATPIQQGLEISGLETTGTTVTIEYADGTTQTTTPFSDGSAAGAVATAKSDVPAAPTLNVQDVTLNESALDARHSAATVSSAQQTIEISGEPGSTVRVLRFEGELNLEDVSGYDLEPYEANRILNFDEQTVTLDSNGEATVDMTLTNSSANGGLNYVVATVEDDQGDTGLTSDPVVLDYDQNAGSQPSDAEATVEITTTEDAFPSGMVALQHATTYFEDSVTISNSGDVPIESVTIDKETAILPDFVYDPTACAGDGGCNPGNTDLRIVNEGGTGLASHQFLEPKNGQDGTDGYEQLQLNFDDFQSGETIGIATDGDPNSIKGGGGAQSELAGPESGIDLTGATVTVEYADGTTSSVNTFNNGSLAGSTAVARTDTSMAPTLGVQDVSLSSTTLSERHTAATVGDDSQTIVVTGQPGTSVQLMHAESTLLLEDVPEYNGSPGYDIEAYEANNVENYTIKSVDLGADGEATVNVTLTDLEGELTSPADDSGFNYFVAASEGTNGQTTTSNVVVLKYEPGANDPTLDPVSDQFLEEGQTEQLTVSATDPNGDALSLSASNLPSFASITDNGDGTGTLTLAPQSGDAGQYQFTLTATDGQATDSQTVTVSVSEPGQAQVIHRLHAGSGTVAAIDNGPDWASDSQYMQTAGDTSDWTGTTYNVGSSVPASTPDAVFETERYPTGGSTIDYDLPATQGETYEVRLYFIEQYNEAQNPGDRVFDVTAEGQTKLNDYDTVADVGYKNATMKSFNVTADDGTLDLTFSKESGSQNPFMYGIEVVKPGDDSQNQAPNASFTAATTDVETGQAVDFDANASSDSDGSIASYEWDFDSDGTTDATSEQVSHAFSTAGTYQVALTVTDDDGATNTTTTTITVSEPATNQVLYRVNTGGSEITMTDSPDWTADNNTAQSQYLEVGADLTEHDQQFNVTDSVPADTPDQIFVTERWPTSGSTLEYAFPATTGESYEVRLYFIEQWEPNNQEGTRIFDVTAEGQTKLNDYDIMTDVGFDNATTKSFEVTADDGTLDLSIVQDGGSASPFIYGIEIVQEGS